MKLVALSAAIACLACSSVELRPPTFKHRPGPAAAQPVTRVVALSATCGSFSAFNRSFETRKAGIILSDAGPCPDNQVRGVDQIVRTALEFKGYSIIDSERLVARTLARSETITERSTGYGTVTDTESVATGSLFEDAPLALQDEILAELGADAILSARILVGASGAQTPTRDVDVLVRLLHVATGELVWASRCRIQSGWVLDEEAIAEAAQCAIARVEVPR